MSTFKIWSALALMIIQLKQIINNRINKFNGFHHNMILCLRENKFLQTSISDATNADYV